MRGFAVRTIFGFLCLFSQGDFARAAETYFSPATDLEAVVIEKIAAARTSIDIAIYTFNSPRIRGALLERVKNGVSIRILAHRGQSQRVRDFLKPLMDAGARARYVTETLHHKFMIVDGGALLNSSANFSGSPGSKLYDENLVYCRDCRAHTEAFQSEFDALFASSHPVGDAESAAQVPAGLAISPVHRNYDGLALFTSSNFFSFYDPRRSRIRFRVDELADGTGRVDRVLIRAIDEAQSEVLVATGHFRSHPLYQAVRRAVRRGVRVVIVLDSQEHLSVRETDAQDVKIRSCLEKETVAWQCYKKGLYFSRMLAETGAQVHIKYYSFVWHFPFAPQMHHKYALIDGDTLYSGSYNWSRNAEYHTFENVSVYRKDRHPEVLSSFKENFGDLLAYGGGSKGFKDLVKKVLNATQGVLRHFDPVTLKVDEIDQLQDAAFRACPSLFSLDPETVYCK